jgi:regulator of sigma E protease
MEVVVFIIVLVALIVVHEAGHFFAAKAAGIRVDEFGIGYPPRALVLWRKGGTEYTLNWLPFGGFVKIFGEDGDGWTTGGVGNEAAGGAGRPSVGFTDKNRFIQALVLVAGIAMNLLFAYVLISITLAIGTPRALSEDQVAAAPDARLVVAQVLPGTPAADAGVEAGDVIKQAIIGDASSARPSGAAFTAFVSGDADATPVTLDLDRSGKELLISIIPKVGVVPDEPDRPALGVAVAAVGTLPVPWYRAPIDGAQLTWEVTKETAIGLAQFFAGIFTFHADLSQVAGPVGIAGAVGTAAKSGWAALLSITAIISINLALINVIPVPALDGGRLLFVLIEAVTRRRIKPSVAQAVNGVGFALLILLMVVITAHDIFKLV